MLVLIRTGALAQRPYVSEYLLYLVLSLIQREVGSLLSGARGVETRLSGSVLEALEAAKQTCLPALLPLCFWIEAGPAIQAEDLGTLHSLQEQICGTV